MNAKHARLIRIGIMAKCRPYRTDREPDPVFGGYFTIADFERLRQIQSDWVQNNHIPLVREAFDRTKPWISTRYV